MPQRNHGALARLPSAWIAGSSPAMTPQKIPPAARTAPGLVRFSSLRPSRGERSAERLTEPCAMPAKAWQRIFFRCARLPALHLAALTVGPFGPQAQLQAMFPGTRQDVRSCTGAPTGRRRPCALQCMIRKSLPTDLIRGWLPVFRQDHAPLAGVTRARQSQSRESTSRTGRSAGQMMPEAARERSCEIRARAPHPAPPSGSPHDGALE